MSQAFAQSGRGGAGNRAAKQGTQTIAPPVFCPGFFPYFFPYGLCIALNAIVCDEKNALIFVWDFT